MLSVEKKRRSSSIFHLWDVWDNLYLFKKLEKCTFKMFPSFCPPCPPPPCSHPDNWQQLLPRGPDSLRDKLRHRCQPLCLHGSVDLGRRQRPGVGECRAHLLVSFSGILGCCKVVKRPWLVNLGHCTAPGLPNVPETHILVTLGECTAAGVA